MIYLGLKMYYWKVCHNSVSTDNFLFKKKSCRKFYPSVKKKSNQDYLLQRNCPCLLLSIRLANRQQPDDHNLVTQSKSIFKNQSESMQCQVSRNIFPNNSWMTTDLDSSCFILRGFFKNFRYFLLINPNDKNMSMLSENLLLIEWMIKYSQIWLIDPVQI